MRYGASPKRANSCFMPARAQHLAAAPLQGAGAEAHLQAGEQGGEGRGAGDQHAIALLHPLDQPVPARHLGVEAFGGQEHHREVGGLGRLDVLVVDALRLLQHGALQLGGAAAAASRSPASAASTRRR